MRMLVFALALALTTMARAETVAFAARDGVRVTAELTRPAGTPATALVLFHMAGSSRGEYRDIVPWLAKMGYLTLAVDQRAGGAFNGIANETAAQAGGGAAYADAVPDMEAAVAYARGLGVKRVGVIGSSYSASLALVLAGRAPGFADAVAAFSPGEYFGQADFVSSAAAHIAVPVFITGAGGEGPQWGPIAARIPAPVTRYDSSGGAHGASALTSAEGPAYAAALRSFLATYLPAQ